MGDKREKGGQCSAYCPEAVWGPLRGPARVCGTYVVGQSLASSDVGDVVRSGDRLGSSLSICQTNLLVGLRWVPSSD